MWARACSFSDAPTAQGFQAWAAMSKGPLRSRTQTAHRKNRSPPEGYSLPAAYGERRTPPPPSREDNLQRLARNQETHAPVPSRLPPRKTSRCKRRPSKPKNGDRRNHGFHGFHRLHGFSDLRVSTSSSVVHPMGEDNSRSKCLVIRVIRAIRGSYFRI